MRVKVRARVRNSNLARSIYSSVIPDNVGIPKGVRVEMRQEGNYLITEVEVDDGDRLGRVISTVEDILESYSIFSRTLEGGTMD